MIRIVFILFFIFTYVNLFSQEQAANRQDSLETQSGGTFITFPDEEDEYLDDIYPSLHSNNNQIENNHTHTQNMYEHTMYEHSMLEQKTELSTSFEEAAHPEVTGQMTASEPAASTTQIQSTAPATATPVLTPAQPQPAQTASPSQAQSNTAAAAAQTSANIRTASSTENEGKTQVNRDIVNWIQQLQNSGADIKKLVFYLSKSFTMEINDPNIEPIIEISNDGMLRISDQTFMAAQNFTTNQRGVIRTFTPESNETFVINFQTEAGTFPFKFRRNNQGDFYELFAVELTKGSYLLRSNEQLPYLLVFASINRNERVITSSSVQAVPMSGSLTAQSVSQINAREVTNTARETSMQTNVQRSRNIIAPGTLNEETVFTFIKSKNPSPFISDAYIRNLIGYYFSEANREDVNHDFAVAQMLHVTNFLRNRQLVNNNNFGGLNNTNTWQGMFPNQIMGVRAHIQHLRAYARINTVCPADEIINPRMNQIASFRGTVHTFDQLYEKWTLNPERYRTSIDAMLRELYSYSAQTGFANRR